ncbi:MAG TPA: septum formation initiator [Stellaceae bacterium]|nr:septum formation initiator [Stellaceae bacterium]
MKTALALLLLLLLAFPAAAEDKPDKPAAPPAAKASTATPPFADAITHHRLSLAGNATYTATAGTIALKDDKGEKEADIFYVAFTLDNANSATRPITYAFNGGPGAASAYLDIGALGPRALDFGPSGRPEPAVDHVADNPDSWLPFTDLVFIDPAGTGFSRAANQEEAKKLYSVDPDLDALAQVIRLHLVHSNRLNSPVYLVGESYGGFRAARLAQSLASDQGIAATGVMLISPVIEFRLMTGDRFDVLSWALRLPSYAAVARESKGAITPETLEGAERFAMSDYLVGLAAGPQAMPDHFYDRVATMTGLDEATVARWRGRIPPAAYAKALRRRDGELVSRYDGTVAIPDPNPSSAYGEDDPILDGTIAPFTRAFTAYAKDELGVDTDLSYRLLNNEVGRHWQWREGNGEGRGDRRDIGAADALARALSLQPHLKLLIAHGLTDLTTPYMMSRYVIDHLPANLTGERVTLKLYPGGHMMYLRSASRHQLHDDAAAFYAAK